MAIVAVSIAPLGEGASVSEFVAAASRVLASQPGLKHELGPMFTTLEGDLGQILAAIVAAQEAVFALGAPRVSTVIKIDERRDKPSSMAAKVRAVAEKLGQGL